jgi:dTDP-4-dehydrorhamnose 3,5-epimerase
MIFTETQLEGAFTIELERKTDERGFFARSFCEDELQSRGLKWRGVQCNIAFNRAAGTLRGMHFQLWPHEEAKLVRVTRGGMYDVIVDIRKDSPTRLQWFGVELNAENRLMLYVPPGFAHGYQTLVPETEVFYHMFEFYHPESARGLRWDDPVLKIEWPAAARRIVSDRDMDYPLISAGALEAIK